MGNNQSEEVFNDEANFGDSLQSLSLKKVKEFPYNCISEAGETTA
jgi:hypothetical protein